MDIKSQSLQVHKDLQGKLKVSSKEPITNQKQLSLLYSPGVASPCLEIEKDPINAYRYTIKANTIAVVSNGSAVLGLGNIGALASLPVMEGKAALFSELAGVNAFPICLNTQNPQTIIDTVCLLEPSFGGINLEDIKAPECFYIEEILKNRLNIPVFHDDQHGTAIVCTAGLLNALKVVKKQLKDIKVVINGMGSAGIAIALMLFKFDIRNIVAVDRNGIVFEGYVTKEIEQDFINLISENKTKETNRLLSDALINADAFIGVSAPNIVTEDMVKSMNKDSIIFAMANPNPEILPELAYQAGAKIVATGRSDYPNQINNVLVFPAIFKGALDVYATNINDEMKMAAVNALSSYIKDSELHENYIIPDPFNKEVVSIISKAVSEAAIATKVNQIID